MTELLTNNFNNGSNAPKRSNAQYSDALYQKLLYTPNKTTPAPQHGKLVNENFLLSPYYLVRDTYKDSKNFVKALYTGESSDNKLGRMNDLGMKVGGLMIAGYLATLRQSKTSKAMEFVGLGSFFASMALWPKLAISKPLEILNGFDIHQKYKDNEGEEKMLFLDPQFMPLSLYSDEQINEIGDRMGVDPNAKDRRELIERKMAKTATQGNTLWMLTAGFASFLGSSLICNKLEPYIDKYFKDQDYKNAVKFFTEGEKIELTKAPIEEDIKKLQGNIPECIEAKDGHVALALHFNMAEVGTKDNYQKLIQELIEKNSSKTFDAEAIADILIKNSPEGAAFSDEQKMKVFKGQKDAKAIIESFIDEMGYAAKEDIASGLRGDNVVEAIEEKIKNTDKISLTPEQKEIVTKQIQTWGEGLSVVRNQVKEISGHIQSLKIEAGRTYMALADEMLNEISKQTSLKEITPEAAKANEKIIDAFFNISKDDKAFEDLIKKLEKNRESLFSGSYQKAFEAIANSDQSRLSLALDESLKSLPVEDSVKKNFSSYYKNIINMERLNVEGCINRPMIAMNMQKLLNDDEALKKKLIDYVSKEIPMPRGGTDKSVDRLSHLIKDGAVIVGQEEAFNELLQEYKNLMKRGLLEESYSGAVNKLFAKDSIGYYFSMQTMYNDGLDPSVKKILGEARSQELEKTMKGIWEHLGSLDIRQNTLLDSASACKYTPSTVRNYPAEMKTYYAKFGQSLTDLVKQAAGRKYNSNKWKKIFLPAAVILTATTLISEFFFGKINNEKLYKRGDKK